MAPFLVDPVSTFILPAKRKVKVSHTTHHNNSGGNLYLGIAIIGGVAVLIAIILVVGCVLKRRKAKRKGKGIGSSEGDLSRGFDHEAGMMMSKEHGGASRWKSGGGYDDEDSASDYSTNSGGGGGGKATYGAASPPPAAAKYHYSLPPPLASQGYYGGQNYSQNPYQAQGAGYNVLESYPPPRQPSRALIPPRAQAHYF